jgi:glutamate N-acetyltransferase/amino-acid N-acetyltransferase
MVDVVFDPEVTDLQINGTYIYRDGNPVAMNRTEMVALMKPVKIDIVLDVHTGSEFAMVYTADLSYDYVKINAEYHT